MTHKPGLARGWLPGGWMIAMAVWGVLHALGQQTQPASTQPAEIALPVYQRALIVPIRDEINDVTLGSLERRTKRLQETTFDVVIFEMDTPGGALGPTLHICDMIKNLRDSGTRTYAWINNKAYSAGTIIALATDGIIMTRNATIGDCQPIMISPGGGPSAVPDDIEGKVTSPLLAELRDSARRNGYDLKMIYALLRPEMQMFWVENTRTGERRFVETRERDELFGITTESRGGGLRSLLGDDSTRRNTPEPVPDSRSRTEWKYVKQTPGLPEVTQPIVSDRELLTMKTKEAVAYGFAIATADSESDLRARFGLTGGTERAESTWMESAIEWLASPVVRSVLFLIMLLGAYTEFQHPGFGLPGAVALVCLTIFLGAPYLAGYAVTWEIVAILLGFALIAVEIFVLPGFGVAGIAGLGLLLVGLLSSFVPQEPGFGGWPHFPTLDMSFRYLKYGIYSLTSGFTGAVIGMFAVARYLPRSAFGRRMIPPNPTRESIMTPDPYNGIAQVGDIGIAESLLRPAGKARFGATLVDVLSEGEYIEKGRRVEVIHRAGNRVVVRRVD